MAGPVTRPHVAIIGAGPAGLMAAEVASASGLVDVTVFERMGSPARKLLLAGRGGLNLTHSENFETLLRRYGEAEDALRPAITGFTPTDMRQWCADLGIATFVGSSGRLFPVTFKTSPLLRAWLQRLGASGVRLAPHHHWRGWDGDRLRFDTPDGVTKIDADAVILALGGASWPQLGADGTWVGILAEAGIGVSALQPANCGFDVPWSDWFRDRFEGEALKNVALECAGQRSRGDVIVTRAGLEGGAIYQIAAPLRTAVLRDGSARLTVSLRPDLTHDAIVQRLAKRQPKQSFSSALRKTLNLSPVATALLREVCAAEGRAAPPSLDHDALAHLINAVPVHLSAIAPMARAISTAGGVSFGDLDDGLMLRRRAGTFVAGEMLDWEAPTGGYLLQACFATGALAGRSALAWLDAGGAIGKAASAERQASRHA